MDRNFTIASRIREVFLSGHWIANTNYREQLLDTDWQQATQKIKSLNSIAALTYHINYYLKGLSSALESGKLEISDQYSFNAPEIRSAADWNALAAQLLHNAEKFAAQIEQLEDSLFDQPFIDGKYGTFLRNMEGVIEHSYYHLGQISLIKKLLHYPPHLL